MYRILIADDEDYVRNLLVKNIQASSLDVMVTAAVGDGKEALKSALAEEPDIVITDIAMPFMNGLELIRQMQEAGLHSRYVVISGYDEFDYARQAISLGVKDYLLKPFLPRELTDAIRKLIQELDSQKVLQQNMHLLREQASDREGLAREKMLKALLEGRSRCEDLDLVSEVPGGWLSGDYYLTGVIRFTGGNWDFGSQDQVEEFLMLIRDGYFPANIRVDAVSLDGHQLVVAWWGHAESETGFITGLKAGLEKVHESLKKYYHIEIHGAFGRPYPDSEGLGPSYKEAMAVLRGILSTPKAFMFYGEQDKQKDEVTTSSQIRDRKNQIRLAVRTGQREEMVSQLHELMKCYASLSNKKNDYISVSVEELVYAIQNDMENAGYDRELAEPSDSMQDKIRYGSLIDMRETLEAYLAKCCMITAENSEETKASAVVKQVRLLIDNNLRNTDLDLEWMADQVHFSSSYVRQIFRQQTGENFGEYLIRRRMEHAGLLLQKTGLRIQEVAEECGYDNQRYFASSFKKFYGCTPTEFKQVVDKKKLY